MNIWIINAKGLNIERWLGKLLAVLPADDCRKALSYRQAADSFRCAVGRALIRTLAAIELGKPDEPLIYSEYGKPSFRAPDAPRFNLSHSGKLIVLAWAYDDIGVDVEEICPLNLNDFDWLTTDERFKIDTAAEPLKEFYRLWTVREAFSKFDGRGLLLFDDKDFNLNNCAVRTFELDNHILTLCARDIPPDLAPEVIPLQNLYLF